MNDTKKKTNIFMKFCFMIDEEDKLIKEKIVFVYSKTVENVEKLIYQNPLFYNLLTHEEIIEKMSQHISYNKACNHNTGNFNALWYGKQVLIDPEEKLEFKKTFEEWKEQLNKLFGAENIVQIEIPAKVFKQHEEYINDDLLSFLNSYSLNNDFENNLSDKCTVQHQQTIKKKI